MIKVFLFCFLLMINTFAHEVQENRAKISIHKESVYLKLSLHANKWTEKFPIDKLDDEILKDTELLINKKRLDLKLRKISKRTNHYEIEYISKTALKNQANSASLLLSKELGKTVVTIIRASTKISNKGEKVFFSF